MILKIAPLLFLIVGVALIIWREKAARAHALIMGGRMGVGCVMAEAIGLIVLALAAVLFREML